MDVLFLTALASRRPGVGKQLVCTSCVGSGGAGGLVELCLETAAVQRLSGI